MTVSVYKPYLERAVYLSNSRFSFGKVSRLFLIVMAIFIETYRAEQA